jgi:hypothetical protein
MNRIAAGVFLLAASVPLAGCLADSRELNEENIAVATSKHLAARGRNWMYLAVLLQPLILTVGQPTAIAAQDALVAAGIMKRTDGKPDQWKRWTVTYELTPAAKPFFHERQALFGGTVQELCWSEKVLDRVVKWTPPVVFGPLTVSEVTHTYKIANVAEWSKKLDRQAIGAVRGLGEQVGKPQPLGLKLTKLGWEFAE